MGDQLAGMLDEIGQQPELGRCEPDLLAAETGAVFVQVDDQVAMLEAARPIRGRRRRPAQRRFDPRRRAPGSSAAW